MRFPSFDAAGDLPIGIHPASLQEVIQHFGTDTSKRLQTARRLERIYQIASATGKIARFIIFGSFVTSKPAPNDVDIFIMMENDFDAGTLSGEAGFCLIICSASRILARVCFGYDGWRLWVANKQPLKIGKSNVAVTNAVSWRLYHDYQ